jgi:hypothetical protein
MQSDAWDASAAGVNSTMFYCLQRCRRLEVQHVDYSAGFATAA